MAYANVRNDFMACTSGRMPARMPVFSLSWEFHQLQAGVTERQARLDVAKAVACQVEAVRKYDEDWAIIFPDDYIEFEPLGLPMRDDEGHPTMPTAYLPFDRETLRHFASRTQSGKCGCRSTWRCFGGSRTSWATACW